MLILSRKAGESIVIANNIVVTVVSVTNGQVRLGIDAPAGVIVDREEIHQRRQLEPLSGSKSAAPHYTRQSEQAKVQP